MLLDANADSIHDDDYCPLHHLARKKRIEGRVEFAKFFVQRGVDPEKSHHKSGKTALEEAIEHDRDDLVEYLSRLNRKNARVPLLAANL